MNLERRLVDVGEALERQRGELDALIHGDHLGGLEVVVRAERVADLADLLDPNPAPVVAGHYIRI